MITLYLSRVVLPPNRIHLPKPRPPLVPPDLCYPLLAYAQDRRLLVVIPRLGRALLERGRREVREEVVERRRGGRGGGGWRRRALGYDAVLAEDVVAGASWCLESEVWFGCT
jgi:hypothetical protein